MDSGRRTKDDGFLTWRLNEQVGGHGPSDLSDNSVETVHRLRNNQDQASDGSCLYDGGFRVERDLVDLLRRTFAGPIVAESVLFFVNRVERHLVRQADKLRCKAAV